MGISYSFIYKHGVFYGYDSYITAENYKHWSVTVQCHSLCDESM